MKYSITTHLCSNTYVLFLPPLPQTDRRTSRPIAVHKQRIFQKTAKLLKQNLVVRA